MRGSLRSLLAVTMILVSLFSFGPSAYAGWLVSSSLGWGLFAFRPEADEKAANYYGIGAEGVLGFSFSQTFDLAGFVSYSPGNAESFAFGKENASLLIYGVQTSLRFSDAVFFGLRAGSGQYALVSPSAIEDEVQGKWSGLGGGLIVGALFPINRENYWNISLEILQFNTEQVSSTVAQAGNPDSRTIDAFRLCVGYTFNSATSQHAANGFFRNVF